jgi:hypothetical protein
MSDLITNIANVSLALSVVVAVVFGIAQMRGVTRERRTNATLDALRTFQTREFSELLYFVMSKQMPNTRDELSALSEIDRIKFTQFAQQMESLGLLVASNLISISLVEKTLGAWVTISWKKYQTVFSEIREFDPYMGEYFQWLSERIENLMSEHPREPFYKSVQK